MESRFYRLTKALASAVSFLPPFPPLTSNADHETGTELLWPPSRPEAQVAVLVAAEATSRQELMKARAYIDKLQHILSSSTLPPITETISLSEKMESFCTNTDYVPDSPTELTPSCVLKQSLAQMKHVCELLEAVLMSSTKLIRGECCVAEFDEVVGHLVEADQKYSDIVKVLKSSLVSISLERYLMENYQLETQGKIATAAVDEIIPTAQNIYELFSRNNGDIPNSLLNECGEVNEDPGIADRFNYLVKKAEYKSALCRAISCLLNDAENASVDSFNCNDYNLDSDGLEIVKRLRGVFLVGSTSVNINQVESDTAEKAQNRTKSVDSLNSVPILKSTLNYLSTLLNIVNDRQSGITSDTPNKFVQHGISNYSAANNLLGLLNMQTSGGKHKFSIILRKLKSVLIGKMNNSTLVHTTIDNPSLSEESSEIVWSARELLETVKEHKLRDYLVKVINSNNRPDMSSLRPENRAIAEKLVEMDRENRFGFAAVMDLLKAVAEVVQSDSLVGLDERLKSVEIDERLLECVVCLADNVAGLMTRYAQAEKDKAELGNLVRNKHAESQTYHALLQKLLTEQQSTVSIHHSCFLDNFVYPIRCLCD